MHYMICRHNALDNASNQTLQREKKRCLTARGDNYHKKRTQ